MCVKSTVAVDLFLCLLLLFQTKEIEDEIDLGQIEEVIEMAKEEKSLVKYYFGEY